MHQRYLGILLKKLLSNVAWQRLFLWLDCYKLIRKYPELLLYFGIFDFHFRLYAT